MKLHAFHVNVNIACQLLCHALNYSLIYKYNLSLSLPLSLSLRHQLLGLVKGDQQQGNTGTQFTCYTSAKLHMLTPEELRARCSTQRPFVAANNGIVSYSIHLLYEYKSTNADT